MYISNEQDGSAARAVVLNGHHYISLTLTQLASLRIVVQEDLPIRSRNDATTTPPPHGPLTGQYSVKINGVTYTVGYVKCGLYFTLSFNNSRDTK
jgi:hypothetical protein